MEEKIIHYVAEEDSAEADRFTYHGNRFPWWMLMIWVGFIAGSTWYSIKFLLPNLSIWVDKAPVNKFVP